MKRALTPAEQALASSRYTIHSLARAVGISVPYLRHLLRNGDAPYDTAQRIAGRINCSTAYLLPRQLAHRPTGRSAASGCSGPTGRSERDAPSRTADGHHPHPSAVPHQH